MDDYKSETTKAYDSYPGSFDSKFEEHFNKHVVDKAERFLGMINGKKILDLGAGPGNHAAYFKSCGYDVTCFDISEEMLRLCREKGLNSVKGDIEKIDFVEEFDGIWAYASLLHVPKNKVADVLNKMAKATKKDGVIGIALKEGKGEDYEEDERYPGTKRWFSYYQQEELESLFDEAGFDFLDNGKSVGKTTTFMHYLLKLKK
jgi:SAM-dependent methyltransferase